jgi:hypothetical protein
MYLNESPKVLKMRIYTGKNESPLFYGYDNEPQVYSIPDKKHIDRPSFLEHLSERETSPADIPDLMLHGMMDPDSFRHLDEAGLVDPILKEMYGKIQDLNTKLQALESMTDANGHMHDSKEMDLVIDEATNIARKLFHNQGKSINQSDEKFDPVQLREGQKVEMEHTQDPVIAKEIAKDHLSEHDSYYVALKQMERALRGG